MADQKRMLRCHRYRMETSPATGISGRALVASRLRIGSQSRPIAFGVAATVACLGVALLVGKVGSTLLEGLRADRKELVLIAIQDLALVLTSGALITACRYWGVNGFGSPRRWTNVRLLVIPVGITALLFLSLISSRLVPDMALVVVAYTLVGFGEELLFRGLLFHNLVASWGSSPRRVLGAAWISSAMFGATHLLQLLRGKGPGETVAQVMYATFVGVFFAAILWRTRAGWALAVIHGAIDIASGLQVQDKTPSSFVAQLPVVIATAVLAALGSKLVIGRVVVEGSTSTL